MTATPRYEVGTRVRVVGDFAQGAEGVVRRRVRIDHPAPGWAYVVEMDEPIYEERLLYFFQKELTHVTNHE